MWRPNNGTAILYGSEEIYRIWGFDPVQGVPSREAVFQRIHPDDRDRLGAEVQHALGEKRRYSVGYRIAVPDGTVKHVKSIGEPAFSATGELIEIVATQIDVTERKRAEEEHERLRQLESDLAHMNRLSMMGEMAASLAHEIRCEEFSNGVRYFSGPCRQWLKVKNSAFLRGANGARMVLEKA